MKRSIRKRRQYYRPHARGHEVIKIETGLKTISNSVIQWRIGLRCRAATLFNHDREIACTLQKHFIDGRMISIAIHDTEQWRWKLEAEIIEFNLLENYN